MRDVSRLLPGPWARAGAPPTQLRFGYVVVEGSGRRVWAPAVKAAGIEWCTPDSLRHTQAALLVEANEHPLVVARRLGHKSVKTVLDAYGHLMEGLDQGAAEKLDIRAGSALGRPRPGPDVVELPRRSRKSQR